MCSLVKKNSLPAVCHIKNMLQDVGISVAVNKGLVVVVGFKNRKARLEFAKICLKKTYGIHTSCSD